MKPSSPQQRPPASPGGAYWSALVVATLALVVAFLTLALVAVVYGMVANLNTASPSLYVPPIRVTQSVVGSAWVLEVEDVPTTHALNTTTVLFRWPNNATAMNPPGLVTLEHLKTARNGIQYVPVAGPSQTDLRILDAINITSEGPYVAGLHITIADGQSLLWQGNLLPVPDSGGSQPIGVQRADTTSNWVLRIVTVPATHAITTTTFLMQWSANSSVVNPPGRATLSSLKTTSGGVTYIPVTGASQTGLQVSDVITISKTYYPTAGNVITIADGQTILWIGTL